MGSFERIALLAAEWRERADNLRAEANNYDDRTAAISGIVMQAQASMLDQCASELDKANGDG